MKNMPQRFSLLIAVALIPALAADIYVDRHLGLSARQGGMLLGFGMAISLIALVIGADAMIRRPMARILAAADRLRRGDLTARVGPMRCGQEFGRLAAVLDDMAAAQEAREQALRAALATASCARTALTESETRLRLALAAADIGISEMDIARQRSWLDERAAALTCGLVPANRWLSQDDPALRNWVSQMDSADSARRREAVLAVIDGRCETLALDFRFRNPDGVWRWIAERGAVVARDPVSQMPTRIVGVWRDITARRDYAATMQRDVTERTAALRDSEHRFRGIFDSAFQLTALLHPDGTLLEANRAALTFFGVTSEQALGRTLWDAVALDAARATHVRRALARAAAGAFVRAEVEVGGAGGLATLDCSLKPVIAESGLVTMLVAEARDITERARLQAQLAQAQKMEAVGQLTGGVAHDFNNLLQAVTGNLDLIHRVAEQHGDHRLLRLAVNAQHAATRGARLTQQLLAFSRRQVLCPERACVTRLVAGMGELLNRAAGETIEVRTRAPADLWPCHIDPAQFESALLNLAINARDAMEAGGTLTIAAANAVVTPAVAQRLGVVAGDYVRVDVQDTGTGIPPEVVPRLFEPFFTTKEVGKGSGLGLSMVHGFVRQSGGAVTVDSEPGQGTTFSLFLPRDADADSIILPPPPPRARMPVNAAAQAILVVEDDTEVRDALQSTLAEAGHAVLTARDADEAAAILEGGDRVDLLICDFVLPGQSDGIDVAERALRRRPGLRVVLASGYGHDIGPRAARFEVLAKPFSQSELLKCVAQGAPAPAG